MASGIGTSVIRFRIFQKFKHVHQTITHFYGYTDHIYNPSPNYTTLLIRVRTIALVHRAGTSRTQRKHQFRIASMRKQLDDTVSWELEAYI